MFPLDDVVMFNVCSKLNKVRWMRSQRYTNVGKHPSSYQSIPPIALLHDTVTILVVDLIMYMGLEVHSKDCTTPVYTYASDLCRRWVRSSWYKTVNSVLPVIKCAFALQWCHTERYDVSNHRRLDCLFNRLFRRRSPYPEPVVFQWQSSGNPVCLELRPQCILECHGKNNCW